MVVTAAQTTVFFKNPDQMGIPHAMVIQLQVEVFRTWQILIKTPCSNWLTANPAAATRVTIPTPSFVFGAKSQHCISVACEIVCYYNAVGHDITAANMRWTQVIKNFEDQWKALKVCKEDDKPNVPKTSKSLPI